MSEAMKAALEQCLEHLYAPLPNCSCHILPPCNDCVEYAGIRDAIRDAKDALSQQPAQPDGALIDEDAMPARQISGYESREDMIQRIVNEASAKDEDHPTVKESLTVREQPSCEPDVFAWACWPDGMPKEKRTASLCEYDPKAYKQKIPLYTAPPDYEALRAKIDSLMLEFCPERMTEEQVKTQLWEPVVKSGQVKVGDNLRFKIGDKEYMERAKLILNPCTDKEEVVYSVKNNFYFITSMIISGFSNHKCVEVLERK